MASVISDQDLQMFLGYFEEPEPGVPVGCTGWYHSAGKFRCRARPRSSRSAPVSAAW